jgi:hypothetical protein
LELAYDAVFFGALAMLEASKLELSSDKGHHKEMVDYLIQTLSLRGNNRDGVMILYGARSDRYDAAMVATVDQAVEAAGIADRVLAEIDGWFQKNHPQIK